MLTFHSWALPILKWGGNLSWTIRCPLAETQWNEMSLAGLMCNSRWRQIVENLGAISHICSFFPETPTGYGAHGAWLCQRNDPCAYGWMCSPYLKHHTFLTTVDWNCIKQLVANPTLACCTSHDPWLWQFLFHPSSQTKQNTKEGMNQWTQNAVNMAFPCLRRGEQRINSVCGSLFLDPPSPLICNSNVFSERTLSAWYLLAVHGLFCFSLVCNDFWYWLQVCALAISMRRWKWWTFVAPHRCVNYCQN